MSLPALVSVLSLALPDPCLDARELAEQIAIARDRAVPIERLMTGNETWDRLTMIAYTYPELSPLALGTMTGAACNAG